MADCPGKGHEVPLLYSKNYDSHPPFPVSIIGPTAHGKTVFIEAILTELEQRCRWPGFSCQWMDENDMAIIRNRLREVRETGRLPDATKRVFPVPRVLRLQNVPTVGGCQLLFFDTSGESFGNSQDFMEAGRYVRHSPIVMWLISITELEYPQQLSDLMTVYAQAMARMGADPKNQAIIIVLTKGDLLHNRPGFPVLAQEFLKNDSLDPQTNAWERLEKISDALMQWLLTQGQNNFVSMLSDQFREVQYCVVSAQGMPAAAGGETLRMELMPRGVLAPLFWLWRLTLPMVLVEANGKTSTYFDISEALANAPESAILRLGAGEYKTSGKLQIGRSLTLRGAGLDATTLSSASPDFAVGIRTAGKVHIADLTIRHVGEAPADVIRLTGGELVLDRCRVSGGIPSSQEKENSTLVSGDGLSVANNSTAVLSSCQFKLNRGSGVKQSGAGQLNFSRCIIDSNGHAGLTVLLGAAWLTECDVTANGRSGILVSYNGELTSFKNRCHRNQRSGLEVGGTGSVNSTESSYSNNNGHGIVAQDRAKIRCQDDVCLTNADCGLVISGSAKAEISGGLFQENIKSGIRVSQDSNADLTKNRCIRNKKSGIEIADNATGSCRSNTFSENCDHGIRILGGASLQVEANELSRNLPNDDPYLENRPFEAEAPDGNDASQPDKGNRAGWFRKRT